MQVASVAAVAPQFEQRERKPLLKVGFIGLGTTQPFARRIEAVASSFGHRGMAVRWFDAFPRFATARANAQILG